MNYAALASLIREQKAGATPGSTLVVAIDGRGGSGKTTLSNWLMVEIGGVSVVHTDDFAIPGRPPPLPSGDQGTAWDRLAAQLLKPLEEGRAARYQRYSWDTDSLEEWIEVPTGGTLIVEGIGTLRSQARDLYNIRVWVECPREVCLSRGLERDGTDSSRVQWEIWQAGEDAYMDSENPMATADLVIYDDTPR